MAKFNRVRSSKVATRPGSYIPNFHVFQPDKQVRRVKPRWPTGSQPLVCHIVPAIDDYAEDGTPGGKRFVSCRDGHGTEGLTNFFARVPVAQFIGFEEDAKTFVLGADANINTIMESYYGTLFRRVDTAVKENAKGRLETVLAGNRKVLPEMWAKYFPGQNTPLNKQAFNLPKKTICTFMSVLVALDGDDASVSKERMVAGANPGDDAHLLMLSSSADEAMISALNAPASSAIDESRADFTEQYKFGDPTQFQGGRWMVVYAPGRTNTSMVLVEAGGVSPTADRDMPSSSAGNSDIKNNRYEVDFRDTLSLPFKGKSYPADHSYQIGERVDPKVVLDNYDILFDYFYVPEPDEQALWLAQAYRKDPTVLLYGFADTPEFFTAEVKAVLAARAQVAVKNGDAADMYDLPSSPAASTGVFDGAINSADFGDDNGTDDGDPIKSAEALLAQLGSDDSDEDIPF